MKCLICFLGLFTIGWFLIPQDFFGFDPLGYSIRSYDLMRDGSYGDHIFDHRLSILYPTVLFYKIFGVNVYSSHFILLISAIIILVVVWKSCPDISSKLWGIVVCSTSFVFLQYSVQFSPDLIVSAFMALALLLFIEKNPSQYIWNSIGVVLSLGIAFTAKLNVYWIIPVLIYYGFQEWKVSGAKEREVLLKRFYTPLFVLGLIVLGLYFLYCYSQWGDIFARFKVIDSYDHKVWGWKSITFRSLIRRLTTGPIRMLRDYYPFVVLFSLIPFGFIPIQSFHLKTKTWIYYGVTCFLFFWFGSTSFSHYQPMPLQPRLTSPIIPAYAIVSGIILSRINKNIFSLIIVLTLFLSPIRMIASRILLNPAHYQNASKIIKEELKYNPCALIHIGPKSSVKALQFYFGYETPKNLKIITPDNIKEIEKLKSTHKIFIWNDVDRSNFSKKVLSQYCYNDEVSQAGFDQIYESNYVSLYEIKNWDVQEWENKVIKNKKAQQQNEKKYPEVTSLIK